jgi:hypothetical protein
MRNLIVRRAEQRMLTFDRREPWQTLPEPDRLQCRDLLGQLLRAVLQAEAPTRSDDERENSSRPS